jgi:hypothetical protein
MHLCDAYNKRADQHLPIHHGRCPWQVIAASVCGTHHEQKGQPCQDTHCWHVLPEGVLVAAIADGAGSAPLGEVGASIAARTGVEAIGTHVAQRWRPASDEHWKLLLSDGLKAARMAIEVEATAREVAMRDLATTLILVAATPEVVSAAQVGDGAVVVGNSEGSIIALTSPESGDYINETTFLSASMALDTAQVIVWHGGVAHVAVLSDGLQMLALKMPGGVPHVPFFSPLFRFAASATDKERAQEQLMTFLRSPRVRQHVDDDLTLLLATLVK